MRLRIWRGLLPISEGPTADAVALEGDLVRLYHDEMPRLRGRLRRRMEPDGASDVLQTAFLRLLSIGSDRFRVLDSPEAYLTTVVDSVANGEARQSQRRLENHHLPIEDYEAAGADPHLALEARDLLRRVEVAIAALPDRTREIFMAHRYDDLTYVEIAKRFDISVKTVEWAISSALRKLHSSIGSPE